MQANINTPFPITFLAKYYFDFKDKVVVQYVRTYIQSFVKYTRQNKKKVHKKKKLM